MIDQGCGAKQVQERLGHASIQTTMDIYGHLFHDKDAESQQARRMEAQIDWNVP